MKYSGNIRRAVHAISILLCTLVVCVFANVFSAEKSLATLAWEGNKEEVEKLLHTNPDIQSLQAALRNAAYQGHVDIVAVLASALKAKKDSLDARDEKGRTAFIHAAWSGQLPVMQHLVQEGADPHLADLFGATALHFAAQYGHMPVVRYLVKELKVPLNARTIWNETSLFKAASEGEDAIVEYLVQQGADVTVKDKNSNKTALQKAQEKVKTAKLTEKPRYENIIKVLGGKKGDSAQPQDSAIKAYLKGVMQQWKDILE
jgi:hypothetical protein